ncbi:hypothetical protein [Paenibacillus sp. IHBB 10380]|uniref:hypothetical protein n=1 Tax=Paenibacillus sp. IHBB 10380 TaxID=1566358 RepID=UPI0005CFE62C|nr:hypothetical protein [Paenibacillus sp. IHBB 10380]AJS61206.1 hypothetical protein UB51_25315 [Paenibacillus sp. IHBB 10380]
MLKKGKLFVGSLLSVMLLSGVVAYAGTNYTWNESRTLPGGNGNVTSSIQVKAGPGAADLSMHATAGLNVDVRTDGPGATGSYTRNVRGGNTYRPSAPQPNGSDVHLFFSSDLFSPDSTITYDWRSN